MILLKGLVQAHDRHGPCPNKGSGCAGRVVHVNAYSTRTPAPAPKTPPVVSYSSGATAPAIMRGYIVSNAPFGVALPEMAPGGPSWDMVIGYAQRGGQVFVDSGAFSAFTQGETVDWAAWRRKVATLIYQTLGGQDGTTATLQGPRLHIVMPDLVGDQLGSLRLLSENADFIRGLIDAGQDALVAVQKGDLSPYAAWREACAILGTDDFTACVPSNRAAFSPADLADLMGGEFKPARVHFLGVAGNRKKLAELAAIVHRARPDCVVTSDANRLRAKVGEGRPVTTARAKAAANLRDAFRQLAKEHGRDDWAASLDDPKHAERVLGPVATTVAIAGDEAANRAQPDLFGEVPLRKRMILLLNRAGDDEVSVRERRY